MTDLSHTTLALPQDLWRVWVVFEAKQADTFHQILFVTTSMTLALERAFDHHPVANVVEVWVKAGGETGLLVKGLQVLEDVGTLLGGTTPAEVLLELALLTEEMRETLVQSVEADG